MTVAIVLSSALAALVLAIALVLPAINSPTVPFGVRVPARRAEDPTVVRQTRIYRWRVLLSGIVAIGVCLAIYGVTGETLLLPLSVLVLVGAWYGCFFLANREIRAAKAAGGWYEGAHQVIAVDTELRTDPPRFPWLWLAPGGRQILAERLVLRQPRRPRAHGSAALRPGMDLNFGNPRAAMILAGVVALIGLVITIRFSG